MPRDAGWRCLMKSVHSDESDKGGPRESERDLGSECRISFFRMVTQKNLERWYFLSLKLASHRTGGCGSIVEANFTTSSIIKLFVSSCQRILRTEYLCNWPSVLSKVIVTWARALPAKEEKISNKNWTSFTHCHHHLLVSWRHMFFMIASWEVKARAFAGSTRSLPLPSQIIALMVSQQRIYYGSQRAAKEAKLIKKENHDEWFGSFLALLTLSCASATNLPAFCESEESAKYSPRKLHE